MNSLTTVRTLHAARRLLRPARRLLRSAGTYLLVLVFAACGNLTPGGVAETTVAVSGDADATAPAPAPSAAGPSATGSGTHPAGADGDGGEGEDELDEVEGEIEITFSLYLVRDDGNLHRLGAEELQAQVDVRGVTESDVVTELVPTGDFTDLRIVFTEIEIEVDGLVIGGELVPEVDVELDDIELVVTRPIDLAVEDGDSVELLVDLNSLAWLAFVDPVTGIVDDSDFEGLVNVVVRGR